MRARVIAIGQRAAGDDAVGLAVLDRLRREDAWGGVELREARDATELIPLLQCAGPVVLIDAFVGEDAPGRVREIAVEALEADGAMPVSSHVLSVRQAIELTRVLYPATVAPVVRIVGISIASPERHETRLSPAVARAVPHAAEAVGRLLERRAPRTGRGSS